MLVFGQPVGSGLVDTTPSGRLCCAGQTGLVCSLSGKNPKSCFRSGLKTAGLQPGGLVTSSCLSLGGSPTALDIAITAPQRRESFLEAGKQGGAAAAAYARVKAQHLQTAAACEGQGVRFQPMVFESTGAFDASTGQVLQQLARAIAARAGGDASELYGQFPQELCSTVRTFRARAALRRRVELSENTGWLLRPWCCALRRTSPDQSCTPCSKRCSECFGPSVYYYSFLFSCWGTP